MTPCSAQIAESLVLSMSGLGHSNETCIEPLHDMRNNMELGSKMKVYTVCLDATGPIGLKLVEERRPSSAVEEEVDIRAAVGAKKPNTPELDKVREGDVLFQLGFKSSAMKSWQWELVSGIPLEDVIAAIAEAKVHQGRLSLRFYRPNRPDGDTWTSRFSEIDARKTCNLSREHHLERKRGDIESSSSRVGVNFQVSELPVCQTKRILVNARGTRTGATASTTTRDLTGCVFQPSRASERDMERYFARIFPDMKKASDSQIYLGLQCLHEVGYDVGSASQAYNERKSALGAEMLWSEEKAQAFLASMNSVRCRDFHEITDEMHIRGYEDVTVNDVVNYFYSRFKTSPEYKTWTQASKAPRFAVPKVCVVCEEDDPYDEAIKCCKCLTRIKHLECFLPPVASAELQHDIRFRRWACEDCSKPAPAPKRPRALIELGLASDGLSANPGVRRSAQLASNVWAAMHEVLKPPRARGGGGGDDDDDDEEARKKRARAAGTYDEGGRKLHYLKGNVIGVEDLINAVDDVGGYKACCDTKQWQSIRKKLNLPHTTSSSTQLREAYLDYAKQTKKQLS